MYPGVGRATGSMVCVCRPKREMKRSGPEQLATVPELLWSLYSMETLLPTMLVFKVSGSGGGRVKGLVLRGQEFGFPSVLFSGF